MFFSGLITNITLEGSLTFFGDKLGVDLSIAAIVAFGVRIFNNLGAIRRHYLLRRAPDFAPWANTCMSGVAGR